MTATVSRLHVLALAAVLCAAPPAAAQPDVPDLTRPAFSLSNSHVASTRERPAVTLAFRQLDHLDFRVYRVNDPMAFFANLRDPHVLGSTEPVVPQELTWLERIASWKARVRSAVRAFGRRQFSRAYRDERRSRTENQQVARRQTVGYRSFAQVPFLNESQVVASWREILPRLRDTDVRRIPLELDAPGVYVVEAVNAPLRAYTIAIVSDVGLVTKASPGQVVLFAANRFSGEPMAGCGVQTVADRAVVGRGTTADDGTYELRLAAAATGDVVTVARCGDHVAATDPGGWFLSRPPRELVGYIYTDKPVYRPGHTVHLKGVLRWRARGALIPFDGADVEVRIADPNNKVVFRERRPIDGYGAAQATFPVPAGAALGSYIVTIQSGEESASHAFEVQEYRKPEFEVIVTPSERFLVQGGTSRVTIAARYYFGQPVAGASATCVVHRQPYYSPFRWTDEAEEGYGGWWGGGHEMPGQTVTLNNEGVAEIEIPSAVDEDGRDYSLRIEARVIDASSREVSGSSIVHATYGAFLLTADLDRYVFAPGSTVTMRVRALDYQGSAQPGLPVRVVLERLRYGNRWDRPEAAVLAESGVETDADGRATAGVELPAEPGDYRIRVLARSGERDVEDRVYAWVPGRAVGRMDEDTYLELVADKRAYAPGEVARLTIKGTSDVPMLVTKETQEVSWRQVTRAADSGIFEVPITEDDVGDTWVNVAFLKDDRLYQAEKRIGVPAVARQLQVALTPDSSVSKPQQPGWFTLRVTDAEGQPVQAQLSVGVIDEAVYGVKPDTTPDPVRFFHRRDYSRVGTTFSRYYSFVGYSGTEQLLLAQRRRPFTAADFKADRPAQPQVRKEFPDAIYWVGDLVTDQQGTARIEVRYPDSLTTWRLTARAITADTRAGTAISRTTTTRDLIVRVITPRFLTEGDEATVPAIVHNYTPDDQTVQVSLKAEGVTMVTAEGTDPEATRTALIARSGEQRFDWRFKADRPGSATFTGAGVAGNADDAVELTVPILPFGLKQAAGTSGSILGAGEGRAELTIPETANPSGRHIRVSLAPSLAGALLGALDYLTSYPYGCTEQTLSSFLPNVMVLKALAQANVAPTERLQALDRQVSEGLRRLYDYQHQDGGWGWWKTDENHPFMTAYAIYGLIETHRSGYRVETFRIRNGVRALEQMYEKYPRAVPDLKAYMAYVLTLARVAREGGERLAYGEPGSGQQAKMLDDLWAARVRMSHYGRAFLLLALEAGGDNRGDTLARELGDAVQRRGDLAWWPAETDPLLEDYGDTGVEATALIVKGLAARDPRHPLLEPAVRWLMLNRTYGTYWASTKQTAMALYGLLEYMRARGEGAAESAVDVFVNGEPAGTRTFTAADLTVPDPVVITVPAATGTTVVGLVKRGGGALYWSASAEYFDRAGPLERSGSRTLALVRTYSALSPVAGKDGRVVYREAPLPAAVAPGDLLLVRLTAAGSRDWRYLVIEDPLPAGAEPIQRSALYELEGETRSRWFRWYSERREYRDDRVVFFERDLRDGRVEFSYLLKVITPGVFQAMPAQVAPMYIPDVRASSGTQSLTVIAPGTPEPSRQQVPR